MNCKNISGSIPHQSYETWFLGYLFTGIFPLVCFFKPNYCLFAPMMRKTCLATLLITLAIWSNAQISSKPNRYTDSLNAIVQNGNDSSKAAAALLLSYYWIPRDTSKSQQFLDKARTTSKHYPYQDALSYFYEGVLLYFKSDIPRSEAAFMTANEKLKAFDTREALSFRSQAWHNYGILQQAKGDEEGFARVMIDESIPLAQQAKDTAYLGKNYLDLAIVFKNTQQYDKAVTYLQEAIGTFLAHHSNSATNNSGLNLINSYTTLAENYVLMGDNAKAKPVLDSAKALLTRDPNEHLIVDYYSAEALYNVAVKKYKEALVSVDSGVVKAKGQGRAYDEDRLLLQKFYALFNLKQYQEAKNVLSYLMDQELMMTMLTSRLEIFKGMAETNAAIGAYKPAYEWSVKYSQLSDSINASRLKNEIHSMEIKYGNAEKQKAIETLKMEKERSQLSARNTKLMIWFLASVCVLLFILAVVIWLYMRNNKRLSQQKDLVHQQQLREIEQQQQIHVGHALLQGEERERRRVAGDLHDGLGGLLAGVKMNLTGMVAATQAHDLNRVVDQLDHSISELRRIARNMMPEALLKFGLETALKEACENLMSDQVNIRFQTYGIRQDIPHEKQLTIYRIVQELLNNAIKHASANEILLQCSQNADTFFITLEDNGKGFDTSAIRRFKGIGLSNVKNRVDYLNGRLEINSTVNEGTSINIELNVGE